MMMIKIKNLKAAAQISSGRQWRPAELPSPRSPRQYPSAPATKTATGAHPCSPDPLGREQTP